MIQREPLGRVGRKALYLIIIVSIHAFAHRTYEVLIIPAEAVCAV